MTQKILQNSVAVLLIICMANIYAAEQQWKVAEKQIAGKQRRGSDASVHERRVVPPIPTSTSVRDINSPRTPSPKKSFAINAVKPIKVPTSPRTARRGEIVESLQNTKKIEYEESPRDAKSPGKKRNSSRRNSSKHSSPRDAKSPARDPGSPVEKRNNSRHNSPKKSSPREDAKSPAREQGSPGKNRISPRTDPQPEKEALPEKTTVYNLISLSQEAKRKVYDFVSFPVTNNNMQKNPVNTQERRKHMRKYSSVSSFSGTSSTFMESNDSGESNLKKSDSSTATLDLAVEGMVSDLSELFIRSKQYPTVRANSAYGPVMRDWGKEKKSIQKEKLHSPEKSPVQQKKQEILPVNVASVQPEEPKKLIRSPRDFATEEKYANSLICVLNKYKMPLKFLAKQRKSLEEKIKNKQGLVWAKKKKKTLKNDLVIVRKSEKCLQEIVQDSLDVDPYLLQFDEEKLKGVIVTRFKNDLLFYTHTINYLDLQAGQCKKNSGSKDADKSSE